jgi:oxygen-independent coproporphyrinogen-3 oxidase
MASYAHALEREMSLRRHYIKGTRIETVYLGGGTPSLLPSNVLSGLFAAINRYFTLDSDAEVTIEANPDDVTPEWLKALSDTPVNRISMGAQTFNNKLLGFLGRRHSAKQVADAVKACKEAGLRNISLDLIYGLPGQTMSDWQSDVERALSLDIKHLSAYALSYEEGTRLDMMLRNGTVREADEELSRSMYLYLMSRLEKEGFLHYEISNFALPGYHSRHNSNYWKSEPYLGLGAGAHSYDGLRSRRANLPDIKAYIAATEDVPHETEVLGDEELYNEFIMTRLRTSGGIPLNELSSENHQYCLSMASPHIKRNLLYIKGEHLCLTREGIFTSNDIISDLMK